MIALVTQYDVTRHYGGPEEGGWYYDTYDAKEVISQIEARVDWNARMHPAFAIARALNRLAKRLKLQPNGSYYQGRFSVAAHTDVVYLAEREYGEHDNTDEVHYYC